MNRLFAMPGDAFATTSDDCYTPRWMFDAMRLKFDLDVAAPHGGPWHVPTKAYYTAHEDGLTAKWTGLVWCNPPYSNYWPWAAKWATHDRGVLVGLAAARSRGLRDALRHADAVAFINPKFERPDLPARDIPQVVFVAFRGVGTGPAERLAAADKYGAVLYGQPSNRQGGDMNRDDLVKRVHDRLGTQVSPVTIDAVVDAIDGVPRGDEWWENRAAPTPPLGSEPYRRGWAAGWAGAYIAVASILDEIDGFHDGKSRITTALNPAPVDALEETTDDHHPNGALDG